MIFNINESTVDGGLENVMESKHPLGLEGALMCVYENECNYNKMMKAVGVAELNYYRENGGDYFVQEAGAFGGFIETAKNFLKKVLEKIKAMVKKFFMFISSKVSKDKDFVKKYSKDLYRVDMTDFEFNGYKFDSSAFAIKQIGSNEVASAAMNVKDNDSLLDVKETFRGKIIGESAMDEKEFRDTLIENSGMSEKDTLDKINIREQLSIITETSGNIKTVEKSFKTIQKSISDYIKQLDSFIKEVSKVTDAEKQAGGEKISNEKNDEIKKSNYAIDIFKSISNDYTVFEGLEIEFYKKRNAQAKAICVKALNYKPKNESATFVDEGFGSIFNNVEFE